MTRARFGFDAANGRPNTFSETGGRCAESVVRTNRRGDLARTPVALITWATVFTQTETPRAFHSAVIRGLPYRCLASA